MIGPEPFSATAHVGAQGRIVLPAAVREAAHLKSGDELIVVVEEGAIRLLTPAQAIREVQAAFRKYIRPGRSLSRELIRERREEVRREEREEARRRRRSRTSGTTAV